MGKGQVVNRHKHRYGGIPVNISNFKKSSTNHIKKNYTKLLAIGV